MRSSSGVTVTDLDGNVFHDLTGSYGVNVFGNDFYKQCMHAGSERVRDLGPVLGSYHPVVVYNVERLRAIDHCQVVCSPAELEAALDVRLKQLSLAWNTSSS